MTCAVNLLRLPCRLVGRPGAEVSVEAVVGVNDLR
jgi:hypothetical protein